VLLFREASKLAADAKSAAAAAKGAQMAASMKAADEAAVAAANAASALAVLSVARNGDHELAAAADLANAAAEKSEQAAKVVKGKVVPNLAARRKRPGMS
jgi:hypothetical protein